MSRRAFVATASALAACATTGRPDDDPAGGGEGGTLVHVGSYTERTGRDGVHLLRGDPATGTVRQVGSAAAGPEPSFLARHPGGRFLYAANELTEWEGRPTGAVSAFAVDGATGALTLLGRRASGGGAPCWVAIDRTGRHALVANYVGGSVAVLPIGADGALGDATAVVRHEGPRGPDRERQDAPHAHCIVPDPTNRWALAADLGIDRIVVYRFDARAGTLAPAPTPFVALPPGAGPRHLAFAPSGEVLYVTNELALTLAAFRWDADAGTLAPIATLPLVDRRPPGEVTAAHVEVAPSGRFAYASVRGTDELVVVALDAATGAPSLVQRVPTGGRWPRHFALDPSGRLLLVANQRSGTVTAFRVDPDTGRVTATGSVAEVPAPVCVRFARG